MPKSADDRAEEQLREAARHVRVSPLVDPMPALWRRARRQRAVRRVGTATLAAAVVAGAVALTVTQLGGHAAPDQHVSVSNGSSSHSASPRRTSSARATQRRPQQQQFHFTVPGYSTSRAATVAKACAAASEGAVKGQLRAAFKTAHGSTLVLVTASGWSLCELSPTARVISTTGAESYADAQGWHGSSSGAGALHERWLMGTVEIDSVGTAAVGGKWLTVAEGRAAPSVAKVSVGMPGGAMVTSDVQNGFFAAQQTLSASPPVLGPGPITVKGYSKDSTLIYSSPAHSASTAIPTPSCYLTPSGQAVTPSFKSNQTCKKASPWS